MVRNDYFCPYLLMPQNDYFPLDSNKETQNESETKYRVESEIHPPRSKFAAQGWKNLRLQVKTARAFSSDLATRNNRHYGYDTKRYLSRVYIIIGCISSSVKYLR